jgi:hypothetical protein
MRVFISASLKDALELADLLPEGLPLAGVCRLAS